MARISNNTVLKEILQEIKEIKTILHRPLSNMEKGEDMIAGSFGVKETATEKCHECGDAIVYNRGIIEVDKFFCLPCWKVKMEKEMIAEVQQEKKKEPIILMDEYEKEEKKPTEQPNSFKQFAEGMKKVECVECKNKVSLAECNYDPARNKYTCHSCDGKLKEAERKQKEAETQEKIKELHGGIK